jgi:ribonuclease HI
LYLLVLVFWYNMSMDILVFADAGVKGNGKDNSSAYGSYEVRGDNDILANQWRIKLPQGLTNNEAEYYIILEALRFLHGRGLLNKDNPIKIRTDSQLVVKQINKYWACKEARLRPYLNEMWDLLSQTTWLVGWVTRKDMVDRFGH